MTAVTRSKKEVRVFWKPWALRTKCTQLQCINIFHQTTTNFTERPTVAGGRHVMTLLMMFIARSSSFICWIAILSLIARRGLIGTSTNLIVIQLPNSLEGRQADIRIKCERASKISQGMDMRSPEQTGTPLPVEGTLDG